MRLFGGWGITGGRREDAGEILVRSTVGLDFEGKKTAVFLEGDVSLPPQVFALLNVGVGGQKHFLEPKVSAHH